jgi:hypothetical protein
VVGKQRVPRRGTLRQGSTGRTGVAMELFDVEMPSERDTLEVSCDGSVASEAAQLLGAS